MHGGIVGTPCRVYRSLQWSQHSKVIHENLYRIVDSSRIWRKQIITMIQIT